MSYDGNIAIQYHRVGGYVGRVLRGEKRDLQGARLHRAAVPALLARADEVIE